MKHYTKNNEIFAFELDGSQDHLITSDMKKISVEEVQTINNAKEAEMKATVAYKIQEAKTYLDGTDHKLSNDYEPKKGEDLEAIKAKRSVARKFIRDNE